MRLVVSVLACVGVSGISIALADPPTDAASANPPAAAPAATPPAAAAPAAPAAAAPAKPADPAAAAKPAASSTAPAATEHAAPVVVSAPQMDQEEKHFVSEGYKVEMRNGEKVYCRREEVLGSHLGGQKQCASGQQLMFIEKDSARQAEHAQHNQTSSPGNAMGK
jgi:hypothetical protein